MTEGHIDYDGWRRDMTTGFLISPSGRKYTYSQYVPYGNGCVSKGAPLMSKWIYIETRMIDGYVSFAHVFIDALNDDDAYDLGIAALDNASHSGTYVGDFLNDYVAELESI